MSAESAKLGTVLGYLLPARSRYLVQRAPTLSTIEKPPAKAVFSFLAIRLRRILRTDQVGSFMINFIAHPHQKSKHT